jgi:hypothetical protein
MTQADSVHSTPPTNTSAIDNIPSPTKPPESPQGTPLYLPTDVTPEELFQAIGRLRKEARDEIERLLTFLDDTDNHMELEPSLGWPESSGKGDYDDYDDYGTYGDSRDEGCTNLGVTDDREAEPEHEEDGADDEPSLGSHNLPGGAVCYLQSVSLGEIDVEGEHDGREPGGDDEPSLCGVNADHFTGDSDREADFGSFDRMLDQTKSLRTIGYPVLDGEVNISGV